MQYWSKQLSHSGDGLAILGGFRVLTSLAHAVWVVRQLLFYAAGWNSWYLVFLPTELSLKL